METLHLKFIETPVARSSKLIVITTLMLPQCYMETVRLETFHTNTDLTLW